MMRSPTAPRPVRLPQMAMSHLWWFVLLGFVAAPWLRHASLFGFVGRCYFSVPQTSIAALDHLQADTPRSILCDLGLHFHYLYAGVMMLAMAISTGSRPTSEPDYQLAKQQPSILDELGISDSVLAAGIFLTGAIGAGKTSVIRLLETAILNRFTPGLIHCCVKQDEGDNAESIIKNSVMKDRCIRLIPGRFTFNFVSYELFGREGGSPETLTRLFQRLNDILQRSTNDNDEAFWKQLFYDYILHASTVAAYAYREAVTVEHIHDCIVESPASHAAMDDPNYKQTNGCYLMLKRAEANLQSEAEARNLTQASQFFQKKTVNLGERARGAGLQQCSSTLRPFLRSPLYETVVSKTSSWTPEAPLNQYCCIVDAPVLVYQDGGRFINLLIAIMTMEAALRRRNPETYVIVCRDEYHQCCDAEFDVMAQSISRSQKLACISAVQNLPLLHSALGGDQKAEQDMRALIGNFATKFMLQNICNFTNEYFAELFGRKRQLFSGFSETPDNAQQEGIEGAIYGHGGFHHSQNEQLDYALPPQSFVNLARGGPDYDFLISCYQSSAGRIYPETGDAFRGITFSQR